MATKKKGKVKHDPVRDAMLLTEYARNPRPAVIAKHYGVHHSYPKRLWESLSPEEQDAYRLKSDDIRDIASERIISEQSSAITQITEELIDLTKLSIAEYGRRLKSNILREDIKATELISFIAKAMSVVQDSSKSVAESEKEKGSSLTQTFNIFDQSIQQNIQNNLYDYEDK